MVSGVLSSYMVVVREFLGVTMAFLEYAMKSVWLLESILHFFFQFNNLLTC